MTAPVERPLWQWVLLALSPALAYDVLAAASMLFEPLKELSVLVGIALPLVVLVVLIILAKSFFAPREDASLAARFGFVLGFGALNALIWVGGCAMTINDMSFH